MSSKWLSVTRVQRTNWGMDHRALLSVFERPYLSEPHLGGKLESEVF